MILSFTFDKQTLLLLDTLKKDMNIPNDAELLKRAIALLEVARLAQKDGYSIGVVLPDNTIKFVVKIP